MPDIVVDGESGGSSDASSSSKAFRLSVSAYDLGNPSLSSSVPVTVFVTDVNDHSPRFDRLMYHATVDEDAAGGQEIIQVQFLSQPTGLIFPSLRM